MNFLVLWIAMAAGAAEIETFPSYARVRALAVEGDGVTVWAEDGSYRLGLSDGGVSVSTSAAPGRVGGTTAGACTYFPSDAGLRRRCARLAEETLPVLGLPVTSVALSRGILYAGTYGGGLRKALSGDKVPGVPDGVTCLADSARGLLAGTEHGLYLVADGRGARIGPRGPADGDVSRILPINGAVWVGHFERGLSRFASGAWKSWSRAEGLPSDWVDDLAFDGARLWGATEKGVFWIEGDVVKRPVEPELRSATAGLFWAGGVMYLAQPGRVLAWTADSIESITVPEQHPQQLRVDAGGIWVAGLDGLWRLSGGKAERYGVIEGRLPGDWVTALAAGPEGLLVGTYDAGLVSLSSGTAPVLPSAWVNLGALAVASGRVAVGEMGAGLSLRENGVWRRFGTADGLPGEDVSAVAFDGGALWVGTRTGLARMR